MASATGGTWKGPFRPTFLFCIRWPSSETSKVSAETRVAQSRGLVAIVFGGKVSAEAEAPELAHMPMLSASAQPCT